MFDKALKALEPNNECQMMALCGMGGVGKSMMMEQLKKVAEDRNMFDLVVKVVIGKSKNKMMIQDAVAENTGRSLTENDEHNRAERLHKRFEGISEDGKKKILVILDDVWEEMDLKDIGLTNPLPKGFKLLLTSRDERVCTQMGVKPCCIFKIVVLEEPEAKKLFWEIAGIVSDGDHDLIKIGEDVLRKCGGLPIAIKTIASTLRDNKDKDTWKDALVRFQNNSLLMLENVFEIRYDYLKNDDEKAIFLLTGLFPDDHNIRIEDLTRYGWGLKLFNNNLNSVSTARTRVKACVKNLIRSNLLIESDKTGYVNIHDLVRDFVLSNFSKVKQASLVNNDNISDQLRRDSYERILLKCGGMVEFPADFNQPNLTLLSLMDGEKLTKFPEDFYTRMQKLQVVAYTGIHKPLLPRRLTTLRTLCLDSCKSLGDISFLGYLINLEVLSLAFCGISNLPSAIGKLKNLKLLDLTECAADLCIDDGIFQSLNKLEELYMRARYWYPIKFTEDSCKGLKMVSNKLTALEVEEFFKSILEPKNVSFKKLERFRISLGAQLGASTSENTLKLVASKEEISECKIDELFEKTEELGLCTNGMHSLEDILKHPSEYSFCNINVLKVHKCADLTCIFTVNVVSSLTKLERLTVSECPLIESLVKGDNSGANKAIKLLKLKFLELKKLPEFVRLCDVDEVVMDLPQLMELSLDSLPNMTCIFSRMQLLLNSKVLIPKLGSLKINGMEKLKEIWCETATSLEEVDYISTLREIKVSRCKSMVNLFPRNPMRLLTHLETLVVRYCSSIEVLFNIDLQGSIGNVSGSSSNSLRSVEVSNLENLKEVWRIEGGDDNNSGSGIIIHDFQGVESLRIQNCDKFRSIFMPTTIYFNMAALNYIDIIACGQRSELLTHDQKQEMIPVVAIPSSLLHTFRQLPDITLISYDVDVVFDMKSQSQSSRDLITTMPKQRPCKLKLWNMNRMTHVWKCNWNDYFICQNQHPTSLFHNITTIELDNCESIKYLFAPLMATLISNLKKLEIWDCKGMEEVVSNRDDDKHEKMTPSTTTLFRHLDSFTLYRLPILKHVGGGVAKGTTNLIHDQLKVPEVGVVYWSLCLYSRKIHIRKCDALSSVIPSYTTGQWVKVEEMVIGYCNSMKEVFSSTVENDNGFHSTTISDEGSGATNTSRPILRHGNITAHKLSNLKTLHIIKCDSLKYIFTFSTLESLKKLKEIRIKRCKAMKVIVREEEEEGDQTTTTPNDNKVVVVFPRLEVIELISLSNLEGFFTGIIEEFQWPLLNDVYIEQCPKMAAFTCSKSIAPRLKYVEYPIFGKLSPERYNFYMTSPSPDQITSPSLESTTSCPAISNDEKPLFLEDIKEINVENGRSEVIIAFDELLQLKNLEKIHAKRCEQANKIFEVELEVTDSNFNNESQTSVVKLPKLREVDLEELSNLRRCICNFNG
ncbi:probable disease resistance protein At4g27220 [Rutidosis leptorrhynchoides]|uniref:probable disease resistance protein At4g27220 n=1 Tax=Rutidosis leptorrhynchoides TaxID=125765 RepID=UPI003A996ACC